MSTPPKVTAVDALREGEARLERSGVPSARLDAELLLAEALGMERAGLYARMDQSLGAAQNALYRSMVERRAARIPVAYILGRREFYSLPFRVTEAVLIPRPETECLVETVLAWAANTRRSIVLLDLGTGCGNIACALAAHLKNAVILASDRFLPAVRLAMDNARGLRVADRITFSTGDLLDPFRGRESFDGIVANLPYIPAGAIDSLAPEIACEPRAALDGGQDGFLALRRLAETSASKLVSGGILALEIGADQGVETERLFSGPEWRDQRLQKDLDGRDRVFTALRC